MSAHPSSDLPGGVTPLREEFHEKPIIVGIYGISGCGKTTLLQTLKDELGERDFSFFDGSDMIASVVDGGVDAFREMNGRDQIEYRGRAIKAIAQECVTAGKVGVVAGHCSFVRGAHDEMFFEDVSTKEDLLAYTHILYMKLPATTIARNRNRDQERTRPHFSLEGLGAWQEHDFGMLEGLCLSHGILFSAMPADKEPKDFLGPLLCDIRDRSEEENTRRALARLDDIVAPAAQQLETVILLDADNTLAPVDAGTKFWAGRYGTLEGHTGNPLKILFSHEAWKYSYKAFIQAAWLYIDVPDVEFDKLCGLVTDSIVVHPEFTNLLKQASKHQHVRIIVVTSGIKDAWELVVHKHHGAARVIGGTRVSDGFVVTPAVKAAIAARLRRHYGLKVHAFGDSAIDIPMLREASAAYVVSGDAATRSKSMDAAIRDGGLEASQVLLPPDAPLRLTTDVLPVVEFNAVFLSGILAKGCKRTATAWPGRRYHATDSAAAKLLMTPMRDARVAGPALRKVHRMVGWWLAMQVLSDVVGVEKYAVDHVQGHKMDGYRLCGEGKTTIVALMRGGEPMASGVNKAFPTAVFVHAGQPEDVTKNHVAGQKTVFLVDSVVNSGRTVVDFVEHVRKLDGSVRIVVVAGVIQAKFFNEPPEAIADDDNVILVTLRLSQNAFKGQGSTDTGNRLFNTTHLD